MNKSDGPREVSCRLLHLDCDFVICPHQNLCWGLIPYCNNIDRWWIFKEVGLGGRWLDFWYIALRRI